MLDSTILIPGGLRLRTVRPLPDRDGSYPLLYDLERSRLVDVPEEFRLHVGLALESGDLDGEMLGWLASEDVLTYERCAEAPPAPEPWAEAGALAFGGAGTGLGQVLFLGSRVYCELALDDMEAALATLDAVLRRTGASSQLVLRLLGGGPVLRFERIARLVEEVERHGRLTARDVRYELTADPAAVTTEVARFLARHPFRVQAAVPEPAAGGASAAQVRGLRRLIDRLPDRLVVHAALGAGGRLAELWQWAARLGVVRVDASKDDGAALDPASHDAELRAFRRDLFDVCDAMQAELELGRRPLLYAPVERVVRRLAAGRSAGPWRRDEAGCMGLVSHGDVLPLFGGPVADELDLTGRPPGDGGLLSDAFWGRPPYRGAEAGAGAGGAAGEMADEPACDFLRAEAETAILFYARLRDADLLELLVLPDDDPEPVFGSLPVAQRVELKTC